MTAPLTDKKDLVFLRVGDTSTHGEWMGDPATRSYDVWLDYYGEGDYRRWAGDPVHLTDGPNTNKFGRIVALLDQLTRYEAIWFPDDDIKCDPAAVERLFATFRRHRMLLAQPSLADGSYVAHEITRWNGSVAVRFTNFIEAMCPLFSRDALRTCVPSFLEARSAFGLDMIWPTMLGSPRDRIGMIDAAPVVHSRPIGGGTWRRPAGLDPQGDRRRVLEKYGVEWPFKFRTYGAVPLPDDGSDPAPMPAGLGLFLKLATGVPPSVRWTRRYWSRTLKSVWRGR
jgi:hypothetical protein